MKFRAVSLNRLNDDTIKSLRIWRNQDFVRKSMFQSHIITEEEHARYIETVKQDKNRGIFVYYLDDEPFAVFQYTINPVDNSVMSGSYLIDENYQVMGYGGIMNYMNSLIEYHCLEADISYAEILDTNKEALRLQERYNGKLELVLKDYITIDGVSHDVYRYSHPVAEPDKEGRIGKLIMQMIEQEPTEDMLLL